MNLEMFSLKGKTAIITGANTGLGQGICVAFAKAGCNIIGVGRRECSETKKLVEDLNQEFLEVLCDVSNISDLDRIIEKGNEKFGKIDILVNNAGIIKRTDSIDVTVEEWDSVLDINLKAAFFLSQKFAKNCIKNNNAGKIINIASMLSYQGGFRVVSYCASKSGINGITKALCNEWAKYNINVNAIAPGYMATNNTKDLRNDEKRSDEILSRIPTGRYGTPDDLMGAAIFLASDASNYVNGFTIAVDGGWLAR